MIERILVAVDGSDSWAAAAAVIDLVETAGENVEVEVLHVNEVEYVTPPAGQEPDETDFTEEARLIVDSLVGELRDRGLAVRGQIRSGIYDDVADDIVAEARDSGADLIVVGCRPRSDLSCWLKGSVAHAVLRRASCPVLVVRETAVRA